MSGPDFWARRKAAVEAEAVEDARVEVQLQAQERDVRVAEKSDAEILADLELPDPNTLGEGDDFKVFLTETIPARIRTRALRRLWLTNPVLANIDGLVDYGEDFTDASCVIENIQTAYQVGKGMTAHVDEMARQAAEEAEAAEQQLAEISEASEDETGVIEEIDVEQPEQEAMTKVAYVAPADIAHEADELHVYAAPRRMRFAFDEGAAET
ncbi:DUF3306 domain-containing protein [Parasedimentitalea maritima]|uniref:DUF3306 domain-containing protein n=1 Tax=Parasedimentitalea maritima TaxID=2578117 RepID=A0A6A4R8G2_9RHOB|nr:DUF3306 domain-containing protein [Zongyanglinia marina]KAE9628208.1 DUF3306 domain-containing protein [Zongyanglinia marina]